MSRWGLVRLERESFDPSALPELAEGAHPASYTGPVQLVSDVAQAIAPLERPRAGELVVTPRSIDQFTGRITRLFESHSGLVQRVGINGLAAGDVLVPAAGGLCHLVDGQSAALAFSPRFVALRPHSVAGLVLWALLSSRWGIRARRSAAPVTSRSLSPGMLGSIRIPSLAQGDLPDGLHLSPPTERLARLLPEPSVVLELEGSESSRWRKVHLQAIDAWDPLVLDAVSITGPRRPIREFASVTTAQGVPRRNQLAGPVGGSLPMLSARDVSMGASATTWAPRGPITTVAGPGDVVVTRIGPRHRVALVDQELAVGSELLVVHCGDSRVGRALASYLDSPEGRKRLGGLESGSVLRRVPAAALARLDVPWPLPDGEFEAGNRRRLADRIAEGLPWR